MLSIVAALCCACTTPAGGTAEPTGQAEGEPGPSGRAVPPRTANPDGRGVGDQPNYDAEANQLKRSILGRLPQPMPADTPENRDAACSAMLDEARELYAEIERDASSRARVDKALVDTRAADREACARETSVSAAHCVRVRLEDRDTELPWLLDQCSRAFPTDDAAAADPTSS